MKIQIADEKRNGLFNRNEVIGSVESEVTPTKIEIRQLLADHFKVDLKLVVIESIKGNFGSQNFMINARIYDSVEDRNQVETKLAREEAEAEKKAAEEEAARKAEEEAARKAEEEAKAAAAETPAEETA